MASLDVVEQRNTACACRGLNPGKPSPYTILYTVQGEKHCELIIAALFSQKHTAI